MIKKPNPSRGNDSSNAGLTDLPHPTIHRSNCRNLGPRHSSEDVGHQSRLSRVILGIDEADAASRYEVEAEDNKIQSPNSSTSSVFSPERKVISWNDGDPESPYNWSSVGLRLPSWTKLSYIVGEKSRHSLHWHGHCDQQHHGLIIAVKCHTIHRRLFPYHVFHF